MVKTEEFYRRRAARSKAQYAEVRTAVFKALGGKCVRCGFTDTRALQVDHIHGGGQDDRKLSWPAFYRLVLEKRGERYQLLCANCNWIKKHEQGETPKGRPRGIPLGAKYKKETD
jgi:5-methylcytosine-specific restriction endonuclease McrA